MRHAPPTNADGDAVINGRMPKRGDYLVNRERVKTQGRVARVKPIQYNWNDKAEEWEIETPCRVVWWSNRSGLDVPSDPDVLREDGYEWADRPLPDYIVSHPFPHAERYPEAEPEPIPIDEAEEAALAHAEKGDTVRAAALFGFSGNVEAAAFAAKMPPKWR